MNIDAQVFQAIVAEFNSSPTLHNVRLNLEVHNGVVTISGRVHSLAERKAVERAVKRVSGIRTVILEIRAAAVQSGVRQSATGEPSTAFIRRLVSESSAT